MKFGSKSEGQISSSRVVKKGSADISVRYFYAASDRDSNSVVGTIIFYNSALWIQCSDPARKTWLSSLPVIGLAQAVHLFEKSSPKHSAQ